MALATCYCNDLYREAAKRGFRIDGVEVEVAGEFGAEGEPARHISYRVSIDAALSERDALDLMRFADTVAEVQNTLRSSSTVTLAECRLRETR